MADKFDVTIFPASTQLYIWVDPMVYGDAGRGQGTRSTNQAIKMKPLNVKMRRFNDLLYDIYFCVRYIDKKISRRMCGGKFRILEIIK